MINIVFRDVLTLCLVLFVAFVEILLTQVTNTAVKTKDISMPQSIVATITWPEGDTDVDLWVTGPAEPVPVGYSNKGGVLWNLLRDDLGKMPDYTPLNFETAMTRGIPPGEYRVNVSCYRCPQVPFDVDLEVETSRDGKVVPIATSKIHIMTDHQEKTGIDFVIDQSGAVDEASLNTVFKPLAHGFK